MELLNIIYGLPILALVVFALVVRYGMGHPRFARWVKQKMGDDDTVR